VNTVTSRDAGAADEVALARLDDDGAPSAATWPQISDGQDHHAIRRGRTAKVAGRQVPSSRVSLDDARDRHGAADGRWWPHSRNAPTELPGLIAELDSRPGIRVQRLSIHRDDWDGIPHRLTDGGGHVVRVDWFTTIPRHTVSVTVASKEPIALLVIPPGTAEGAARAAMNMAATGPTPAPPAES
jgi:hypothetical protein